MRSKVKLAYARYFYLKYSFSLAQTIEDLSIREKYFSQVHANQLEFLMNIFFQVTDFFEEIEALRLQVKALKRLRSFEKQKYI
ncbi:MAG: hypothetical protein WC025_02290 [Candidatus Magasanikbacteria bacterium]